MCWLRSRDNVCGVLIGWGVLVLVSDWVILVVAVMMVVMVLVMEQ